MEVRLDHPLHLASGMGFGPDLLPEIAWCGFCAWTRERPQALGRHAHTDHFEIHYLLRGKLDWWVAGRPCTVSAGQLFITRPGDDHDGMDRVLHRCDVAWIALKPPFPHLDPQSARAVEETLATLDPLPFDADPGVLPAVVGVLAEGSARGPFAALAVRAHLHLLLAGIVTSWRRRGTKPTATSPAVERGVAVLRERLGAPLRIDALAKLAGVSRSTLHERFVAELGMSPNEYLTHLRMERAKELLAGATNAEVAGILGFASAQHFATVFRRRVGTTPGGWRRQTAVSQPR